MSRVNPPTTPAPTHPTNPVGSDLARHWALEPGLHYLNHGSFGACPTAVLDAQREFRARMECDAVSFFVHDLWALLDASRDAIAPILGAPPCDLVFVPNATTGVAVALNSFPLEPGDEVLFAGVEYPACRANARRVCDATGAVPVEIPLPWPIADPSQITDAVLDAVTDRTKLCLLSHIVSSTGSVLPAKIIVPALRDRGVETVLDAAHAPGQIPCDWGALAPAFAAANLHKWCFAPKGCAVLWVRPDMQAGAVPPIESNYSSHLRSSPWGDTPDRNPFHLRFDYLGTDDQTAYLSVPEAVRFMRGVVPGGIPEIRDRNHALAIRARQTLCDALGVSPTCPDSMTGSMATLLVPGGPEVPASGTVFGDPVQDALYREHRIQVPVWRAPTGERAVRISAQLYNSPEQFRVLAEALHEILRD